MAKRGEKLDRLTVSTPCQASWDGMAGEERKRHCALCRRDVLDFARLTEAEIHAHLEASRGRLCARLTRAGGRLVIQPAVSGGAFPLQRSERRASPLAATFVTAFLASGLASARAEAPRGAGVERRGGEDGAEAKKRKEEAPAPAASATLRVRVVGNRADPLRGAAVTVTSALDGRKRVASTGEDGVLVLDPLAGGLYDIRVELEGFEEVVHSDFTLPAGETRALEAVLAPVSDERTITVGAIGVEAEPIRSLYQKGEVVVAARAGASRLVSRDGDLIEVETELLVEATYKGRVPGRKALYRHSEYLPPGQFPPGTVVAGNLVPGARLLAFLEPAPEDAGSGPPVLRSIEHGLGLRVLQDSEREAYLERTEALARLDRKAGGAGIDPSDLMEWLVETAEEAATRGEAAREIHEAVWGLDDLAKKEGKGRLELGEDLRAILDRYRAEGGAFQEVPRPAVLGAALSERQEARLTAALRRTGTFRDADVDLYQLVLRWDEGAARKWLRQRVHGLKTDTGNEEGSRDFWLLVRVAADQGDEKLEAAAGAAASRRSDLVDDPSEGETASSEEERGRVAAELFEELRARILAALAAPV